MGIETQLQSVINQLYVFLPLIGLLCLLGAGMAYALGRSFGSDEIQAKTNTWAKQLGIGGASAVIVSVVAPAAMTWLQGF